MNKTLELLIQWLDGEMAKATLNAISANRKSVATDFGDLELEIDRHNSDGWLAAITYVLENLEQIKGENIEDNN